MKALTRRHRLDPLRLEDVKPYAGLQIPIRGCLCLLETLSRSFAALPRTKEESDMDELEWDSPRGPTARTSQLNAAGRQPSGNSSQPHSRQFTPSGRSSESSGRLGDAEASTTGRGSQNAQVPVGGISRSEHSAEGGKGRVHRWAISGTRQNENERRSRLGGLFQQQEGRRREEDNQSQGRNSRGRQKHDRLINQLQQSIGNSRATQQQEKASPNQPPVQQGASTVPGEGQDSRSARHRWLAKTPIGRRVGNQQPRGGLGQQRLGGEQQQATQSQQGWTPQPHQSPVQPSPEQASAASAVDTAQHELRPAEPMVVREAQPEAPQPWPRPKPQPKPKPVVTEIQLSDEVTIRQLAQQLDVPAAQVEQSLLELGERPSSHEDILSPENAELAAMSFGKTVVFSQAFLDRNNDAVSRPPVVTIMGHVDHGKTTLLDALRKTSVAAGEAGGITQSIGAFQVTMPDSDSPITFLDTPGHAAFTAMRARGAAVTDVIVLVVAADDGVKPQTREALQLAQASGCPIVVALTKCDRPGADPSRAKQQLAKEGLELEDFGGTVQVIETAAPLGQGLVQLEEALLFQAELMSLQASHSRPAVGSVVEARVVKGQGAMATVIVKRGTLKIGQNVVVGSEFGKVRALKSASGESLEEVLPGVPVEVSGLRGMPQAGDDFLVQASEELARKLATARAEKKAQDELLSTTHATGGGPDTGPEGTEAAAEGQEEKPHLVLIVKADTQGSAEALCASLEGMSSDTVGVKAVQAGLGPISMADVDMAVGMEGTILGFNVKNSNNAVISQAKQKGVAILRNNVIYHVIQEVAGIMAGLAPQIKEELIVGEANILQLFPTKEKHLSEKVVIAGCRVETGSVKMGEQFRVVRGDEVVWTGTCRSMKRQKLEVRQVGKNTECGISLEGFNGFQEGDMLHCFTVTSKPQSPEGVANLQYASK